MSVMVNILDDIRTFTHPEGIICSTWHQNDYNLTDKDYGRGRIVDYREKI